MEPVVLAEKITKIYGDISYDKGALMSGKVTNPKIKNAVTALSNVSLAVYEGDFICIMGPSGSGKSTLIQNLSTIDVPTKGRIKIQGKDVRTMSEGELGKFRYEHLGFIFQDFNLVESLTLFENIALPLTLAGAKKKEIEERVKTVAEQVDISQLLDKYPAHCSGGQCQRTAIARALVAKPKLIIADEPTGNLDSKNSHETLRILKELNQKEHVTILMVTHDSMIASYAKKMIFILDGKIHEELSRGDMSQKEFYLKIMEMNSRDCADLFLES